MKKQRQKTHVRSQRMVWAAQGLSFVLYLFTSVVYATPPAQPISLSLPPGNAGIFDSSLEGAPDGSTLWMSYSTLGLSTDHVNLGIGTRLASSTDHGAQWHDQGVNLYQPIAQALPASDNQGFWEYEVSSLVYDQDAPPNQRWKVFAFRYLQIGVRKLFDHSWISLKTASAPNGTWSNERKIFTGSLYVTGDNSFIGLPEVPLHLISDGSGGKPLSDCAAFTEPGAISKPGALYLALNCATGSSHDRIVLLKLSHPSETWSYVGVLVRNSEAPKGFTGLSAADLVSVKGIDYMLASPTLAGYKGCVLYQFASLASGQLVKQNGVPISQTVIPDDGSDNNGACSYDALATASGILYLRQFLNPHPESVTTLESFVKIPSSVSTVSSTGQMLNAIQIFPNPLRPALGQGKINFTLLPPGAQLRIYTLAGEKVYDISADSFGSASWDATHEGKKVASGVYIVHVQAGNQSKTLKVAVQR